jgi:hypothetical protein
LHYRFGLSSEQKIWKSWVVRITGDWKGLGLDIPDGRPSADLNQDGKVDAKDLFLFQRQWNR